MWTNRSASTVREAPASRASSGSVQGGRLCVQSSQRAPHNRIPQAADHWRPYTAIRAAEIDGNSRTEPDANWQPLRPTPPFREYVSAHAAACGASFAILRHVFGHRAPFTMESSTAPPGTPTRAFESFDAAAAECADSRVRLGWHFRYATGSGALAPKPRSRGMRSVARCGRRANDPEPSRFVVTCGPSCLSPTKS